MYIVQLLLTLRKIAYKRLVDKGHLEIGPKEVNKEIDLILAEYNYGLTARP